MQTVKKTARTKPPEATGFLPKLFAGLLLFVLVLFLSLVAGVHIPAVQEYLLRAALGRLEAASGLSIQVETFHWSPFRELRLLGLKVQASGEEVVRCETARLNYQLSWTWPYIRPESIFLEKPFLRLERDSRGQFQLFEGKPEDSSGSPAKKDFPWSRFPWPQVRISSGTIIAVQDGQTVLSLKEIDATLMVEKVSGADGPRFKLRLGQWQGCAEIPDLGQWRLTGEGEIRGRTLIVSQLELNIPGAVELLCRGNWDLSPPFDGSLQIQVVELIPKIIPGIDEKFPQLKEITGSAALSRRLGTWSIEHDLQSNLGNLQGALHVEVDPAGGGSIQFSSRFSDLNMGMPGQPGQSRLSGQIELVFGGRQIETGQAKLWTVVESSTWGDQTIHRGELRVRYDRGMVDLDPSRVQSSIGDFDFVGTADLRGIWDNQHRGEVKLDLRAERASLEKIVGGSQRLGGSAVFEGRYDAGDFNRWERWQAKMDASLSLPEFLTLKASGSQKNQSLLLDYDLAVNDLQKLAAFLPAWQGKGRLNSRGNIKGTWPDLVWEGTVGSPSVQTGRVQADQVSLKGKGRMLGNEGPRELALKIQNLTADGKKLGAWNIDLQQDADTCRFNVKADGVLNQGGARLSGRVEKVWGPISTLLLSQSAVSWKNLTASLDAKIEAGNEGFRVQAFSLQRNKEKLQLSGELRTDSRTDLKLSFEGIDLGQWSAVLSPGSTVSGTASGQIALKGPSEQPEASVGLLLTQGSIALPKGRDSIPGASRQVKGGTRGPVIDRLQFQGALAKNTLNLQGDLQSQSVQTPVHLSARIPMQFSLKPPRLEVGRTDQWAFSFKVAGLQAGDLLPYITPLQSLGGRVDVDAEGGGTPAQPVVAATGVWRNGSMTITKWPHPVDNIQADWQADARSITILRSTMELLGGHVEVKGRVGYPAFQDMDFEAIGNDLEAKDIYGIKGRVTGQARLTATPTSGKLTAELNLAKAEMDLGRFETGLARTIRVIEGETKGEVIEVRKESMEQDTFFNRMEMDLTINLPPSGTWVRGMGLDAEITGALKIVKRPYAAVKLRGGFQTLRGEYRFQDYKLKIVDGELIFPESPQPDPQLKIVCQKDVKDAIIQVQVTGPLKQPKLVMSSMPSMNQVDILSYLFFDRPAGDLSSKESFQLQDKAASWLGSQTSLLLKRVFGDTPFTPDTIEYRKELSRTTTGGTANKTEVGVVAIGKYVTPDLYVNFEKDVTGEEGNQVEVEYRLNRYLSIQTQFGGTKQSGIDVFWRYDFGQ